MWPHTYHQVEYLSHSFLHTFSSHVHTHTHTYPLTHSLSHANSHTQTHTNTHKHTQTHGLKQNVKKCLHIFLHKKCFLRQIYNHSLAYEMKFFLERLSEEYVLHTLSATLFEIKNFVVEKKDKNYFCKKAFGTQAMF